MTSFVILFTIPIICWAGLMDPFTDTKFVLIFAVPALYLLVTSISKRGLTVPVLPKPILILAGLLLFHSIFHGLYFRSHNWQEPLLMKGSFILAIWMFYDQLTKRKLGLNHYSWAFVLAGVAIAIITIANLFGVEPTGLNKDFREPIATFGNVNMLAQFVGLTIIPLIFLMSKKSGKTKLAIQTLLIVNLSLIWILASRSVILATAISLAVLFVGLRNVNWRQLIITSAGSALIIVITLNLQPAKQPDAWKNADESGVGVLNIGSLYTAKESSTSQRLLMLKDALRMLRDNPLGVGYGNFGYIFPVYRATGANPAPEFEFDRSPHNEYLRVFIEEGLVFILLGSLLLFFFFKTKESGTNDPSKNQWYIYALLSFLGAEALFQFPMLLPVPTLVAAFCVAWIVHEGFLVRTLTNNKLVPAMCAVIATMMLGLTYNFGTTSHHNRVSATNYYKMAEACSRYPSNWRVCLSQAWLEIERGETRRAKETLMRFLDTYEYVYPAFKLWARAASLEGNTAEMCAALSVYEFLLKNKSTMTEFFSANCDKGYSFPKEHPLQKYSASLKSAATQTR